MLALNKFNCSLVFMMLKDRYSMNRKRRLSWGIMATSDNLSLAGILSFRYPHCTIIANPLLTLSIVSSPRLWKRFEECSLWVCTVVDCSLQLVEGSAGSTIHRANLFGVGVTEGFIRMILCNRWRTHEYLFLTYLLLELSMVWHVDYKIMNWLLCCAVGLLMRCHWH